LQFSGHQAKVLTFPPTPGSAVFCLGVYEVVVVPPATYIRPHSGQMAWRNVTVECATMPFFSAFWALCATCSFSCAATAKAACSGETEVGDWKETDESLDRSTYFLLCQVWHCPGDKEGSFDLPVAPMFPVCIPESEGK